MWFWPLFALDANRFVWKYRFIDAYIGEKSRLTNLLIRAWEVVRHVCPLIEKHLEWCVVKKKTFTRFFPFNDFKWWLLFHFILYRRACLLIINTDIDRLLKPNMFQITGLIRLFMCVHSSDLIFLWFDRWLACSTSEFVYFKVRATTLEKMRIYSKSICPQSFCSLTMKWNKTLFTLIKFNSQLKCTHRVNNRHATALARDKTFLMWNSFTHNDESVHAVKIWRS